MSVRTITDLDITKIRGAFLIKTRSGSWYQLLSESNPEGSVIISGGKDNLPVERVRSNKSLISIGSKMFFWRQDGENYIRSTEVASIYDITAMDNARIAELMTP